MRRILFRGGAVTPPTNHRFIYGDLAQCSASEIYIVNAKRIERVNPSTVGQFTGEKDSNKKLIFEGDFLRDSDGDVWVVRYSSKYKSFVLKLFKGNFILRAEDINFGECEKIGNIHKLEEK